MSESLRLAFAGTPAFAVPSLKACIAAGADVRAVLTQPDRRAGRGRHVSPSPVKAAALEAGLRIEQPDSLKSGAARGMLDELDLDLLVVVAYGLILPRAVLDLPRLGGWNVHASLLPRWRGAAPIQRAILAGDRETGVCLMQMRAGLDTGPVLLRESIPIGPRETAGSLHDRLATLGADVLSEGLRRLRQHSLPPPQDQPETGITYAHKLDKREARLDFARPAPELERQVRAFDPWPVAEAEIEGERLRIWSAQVLGSEHDAAPGNVLGTSRAGLDIACGEGALRITQVQRAGGRRMEIGDYLNARPGLRHAGD